MAVAEVVTIMRTSLLLSVLALAIAAPMTLLACSGDEKKEEPASAANEIIQTEPQGAEGDRCWKDGDCQEGLNCKTRPHGPPPGAVGMPVPAGEGHHFPPGAVGMPMPPDLSCQQPAEGEKGSTCRNDAACDSGLYCEFESESSGPPPGAVGLPIPAGEGHSFPPGAMGMPILRQGKCAERNGPPPGAVGMPIHH